MIFDAPNSNRCWADLLVEELLRCGVRCFCLAPGSRSTPLVTAVAAHPEARAVMHYDERGTAFFALGYARATGQPAAWITTSGTAVANGLPAVVEAATDGVPMLLLTADRPPELRDTRANQTIDQVKLFGDYVRWHMDVPAPDPAVPPAYLLTTVDQAVHRARSSPAGPVHLNLMFREPLAPDPGGTAIPVEGMRPWYEGGRPFTAYPRRRPIPEADALVSLRRRVAASRRGLVVAGRLDTPAEADAVARFARMLGWPLLPDVGSQLRLGPLTGGRILHYDLLLHSGAFRARHTPDAVLYFGRGAVSKRLMQFLEQARPSLFAVVREDPFRFDPTHQVTHRIEAGVEVFVTQWGEGEENADPDWRAAWEEADAVVAALLDEVREETLVEPLLARTLSRLLPDGSSLFLASSMPVRDMDAFAAGGGERVRVAANRGASGIDGTVAAAAGFADGLGAPVTLLIGDLALLHDLNSLALLRNRPVVVVAFNNDGGGIFHHLPIHRHREVFEPYFGTPHGYTFRDAAAMFGLAYDTPDTLPAFEAAYSGALLRTGGSLIEVRTDRDRNRAFHERLAAAVKARFGDDG